MLLNDVRLQKNSSVALTTGSLSLVVGSLLLSLSAFSVYRLNHVQDITINAESWNWMGEVHLRLDAGQEALGPQLSEAEIPEQVLVQPVARATAHKQPHSRHHSKWIAKAKSILRKAKPPVQEPETKAVIITKKDEPKSSVLTAQAEPTQATLFELNTLQGLRQKLRGQFLIAMTTQPQLQAGAEQVLVAQTDPAPLENAAVEVTPEAPTFHSLRRKKNHHHQKAVTSEVAEIQAPAPASIQADAVTTQQAPADTTDQVVSQPQPEQLDEALKSQLEDQIHAFQAAPQNDYSSQVLTVPTIKAEAAVSPSETQSGKILVSSGNQTVWVTPSAVVTQTHAVAKANPQPSQTQGQDDHPSILADVTTHGTRNLFAAMADSQVTFDYSTDSVISQLPAANIDSVRFTEAFDWVSPVSAGHEAFVSKEFGNATGGWIVSQAAEHWPTLSRHVEAGVPLISRNTSKLLSALAGAPLQSEAGIVFGKVPAGWTVRLSSRSERPVFLNERNQTIASSNLEGERYFAFLNVAPGAHLMYLADRAGSEEGAIGITVLGGVATYTDLSVIKKTVLSGRVFDGSDLNVRSMNGVTVRVLGALNAHSETSRAGRFTIENVLTVGDYPIYVETDAAAGYTHRYQLSTKQLQDATLYRLSESAIQTWVNQLEGAISPDSGIVVTAVPEIIKGQTAKTKLTPTVMSLAPNPTLRPEVYTLSTAGQMQVGQPLDAQNSRFVSVQVPEGPAIARVVDPTKSADKRLLWSDIIMVSPAVVNVVGPF